MTWKTAACVFLCSVPLFASVEQKRGAKAIFVESMTGSEVKAGTPAATPRHETSSRKPAAQANRNSAEVTGVMYYVELVSAAGERTRVSADHIFRSGDRILLHVISSIDADVAVYQKRADGRAARLFPDARINAGSAAVGRGVDTVLPSPTSWFRFDDEVGTEHLVLMLTPRRAPGATPQPAVPAAVAEAVRYDDVVRTRSKGLIVETESSGSQQGTYVVGDSITSAPADPIVVTITLVHR